MILIKNEYQEYWLNDKKQQHGEYKLWWPNGKLSTHCFYFNGKINGEYKLWGKDGELIDHEYWCHGKRVRDLIIEPVTEEDKFLLTLEYGGQWLCD